MARNRTPRFMNLFSPERKSARTNRWRKRFPKFTLSSWHSRGIVETVCSAFRVGAQAARAVSQATGSQVVSAMGSRSLRLEGLEARQLLTTTPWSLATQGDFSQDWSNTGLITVDDNWNSVPSIVGDRGDGMAGSTGVDPQTVLGPGSGVVDVNANLTNPTSTTGGVGEFHGNASVGASFSDNFDSYANQAAFLAAWPQIGTAAPNQSALLSTEQAASGPNSIKVPGTANNNEYRNRRSFSETPVLGVGDQLVWSFDFYDINGTNAPSRNYSNLQDATGGANSLVSMGLNNTQTGANSGGQYYMARIVGYTTVTTADPDGGPAESVAGVDAYFKLNDFTAPHRSTGWHNLKVVITTDNPAQGLDYGFYVDNVLAERVQNIGTSSAVQWDSLTIGSGVSNGSTAAYFDNQKWEFIPFNNSVVALQGSGTARAPSLNLYIDSTARENVTINYKVRDIDHTGDNAIQRVALQYRVGNSGNYINVPSAFISDATSGSAAIANATVSATMPAWSNQSGLQFRIITTDAAGNDEWVGIDDITVTSTAIPNSAPQFENETFTRTLSENSPNDSVAAAVGASDPNSYDSLTYSIISGNESGAFTIDAVTGTIYVADSSKLDFEQTPQFVLTLKVTDNGAPALSDTMVLTFNLSNEEEPPVIQSLSLSDGPYLEGSPVTATATAADPEGTALTYRWKTFRGGGLVLHETAGVTREYTYTPVEEGQYTIQLTVEEVDGSSVTTTSSFTVDNTPPVVSLSSSLASGQAVAIGHDFTLTLTSSDPGDDTLSKWFINWGDGSEIQEVTASPRTASGGGGGGAWLTSTTVTHQYATSGTYTVSATGEDEDCDGTADDRYATNSISVTADTLPVINLPPTAINAKVGRAILKSFFESGDVPTANQFTLAATSGSVVSNGDGTWTWTDSPTALGPYDVTLTFTKPNGLSSTGTFSVSVIPNTAPTFSPPGSVTVAENSSTSLLLEASDDDTPAAQMHWEIVGGSDASKFVVNSHSGAFDLGFASPPDFESPADADQDNTYEVTVRVTDLDGGQSSATILFAVTNIDDASPVADVGGPYENIDSTLPFLLDGTRSSDDGTIQSYEWSLIDDLGAEIFLARGERVSLNGATEYHWDADNDGQTDDAVTSSPSLVLPPHTLVPGSYTLKLRVVDATGLTSTGTTAMSVVGEASRISVLSGDRDGDGVSDITIEIVGGDQNDVRLELASSPGGGMPIVNIYEGDTLIDTQSGLPVGGKIFVLGGSGDDTLRAFGTFSDGTSLTEIVFDGGGGFDSLSLSMNYAKITYDYRSPSDGKVSLKDSSLNDFVTIDYTNLEPIANTGAGADAEFILTGGADSATLTDLGGGLWRLSGASFEDTDFMLPSNSLTIRGAGDSDSITIASALSAPTLAVTLDFETINLAANITAASLAGGANTSAVNVQNNTAQIADAIALVAANGTVSLSAATFSEDVVVNKDGVKLIGSGPSATTIRGVIDPLVTDPIATVRIAANSVEVAGMTITRDGNTVAQWNLPTLNSAGLAIQGAFTGAVIHDVLFTGNRSAIDINNSSGHTIRNNVIIDNHTGVIFRNVTDNITFTENAVTNNRTVGVLFLDASGGSNVPAQQAQNSFFNNNNISGNWYGEVVDRQAGGSLPAPGTTNTKNFQNNWYGAAPPVVTTANSAEPGYASLIPPSAGGSASNPGGAPDIAGPGSANIDYTPFLQTGLDTDVETTPGRGIFGFQGFTARPEVWVDDDWTILVDIGPAGLSQGDLVQSDADDGDAFVTGKYFGYDAYSSTVNALNAVQAGGTIHILVGSFTGALNITKNLTIDGRSETQSLLNAGGASTGITVASGVTVAIDDISLSGIGAAGVGVHVQGNLDLTDSSVTGGQTVVFVDGGDLDLLRSRVQAAPSFSIYGVSVAGGGNADIVDSEILGNGVSTAASVAVSGSVSQASTVAITGSVLASSFYGLLNNPYGSSSVHTSDLSGAMLLGVANSDPNAIVDASNNWWNTTDEDLVLAETLGRVDITPFLNTGDTSVARGFQANTSILNVTTNGEQSGPVGRIQEGVNLVEALGTVSVRDGVYAETVLVDKTATLKSTNLHGAMMAPTAGSQQTVVGIDAADVVVDGLAIQVNQNDDASIAGAAPIAPVGIGAVGTVMDGLVLSNNQITSIGDAPAAWTGGPVGGLTVRAAGIVLNDAPSGAIPSVTLTGNSVNITSGTGFHQRGVWLSQLNADITGNTFAGVANDLIFQFASGGSSLIQSNFFVGVHHSGGGGVVIGDPNSGAAIDILGNSFLPWRRRCRACRCR